MAKCLRCGAGGEWIESNAPRALLDKRELLALIREADEIVSRGSGPSSPDWTDWQQRALSVLDGSREST